MLLVRRVENAARGVAANRPVEKVLVVEDDLPLQRLVCRVLESVGYRVEGHRDGGSVVEAARRSRFHVIIADVKLPGADGRHLVRMLRAHGLVTPVVLTSSEPIQSWGCGDLDPATRVLPKPFELGELVSVVDRLVFG